MLTLFVVYLNMILRFFHELALLVSGCPPSSKYLTEGWSGPSQQSATGTRSWRACIRQKRKYRKEGTRDPWTSRWLSDSNWTWPDAASATASLPRWIRRVTSAPSPFPGVKGRLGLPWKRRDKQLLPPVAVTPLSNLLFIASLALTVVSFLCGQKMSLSVSATLSGILLIAASSRTVWQPAGS